MLRKSHLQIALLWSAIFIAAAHGRPYALEPAESGAPADTLPEMPAKVYDKIAPVMVEILCGKKGDSTGSGVVVGLTPSGRAVILTACHVVARNFKETDPDIPLQFHDKIAVKIGLDSLSIATMLIARRKDRTTDMALLVTRSATSHRETIKYNHSGGVKPGQIVAAFGFPGGDQLSQTVGRITKRHQQYFVFDAGIAPGNSGGPLIDKAGRMIGMAVFYEGFTGKEGYALSMDFVLSVAGPWLKNLKLAKFWQREKYINIWQQMYQDPKVWGPGIAAVGGGVYWFFIKPSSTEEVIFGDPPPVPTMKN